MTSIACLPPAGSALRTSSADAAVLPVRARCGSRWIFSAGHGFFLEPVRMGREQRRRRQEGCWKILVIAEKAVMQEKEREEEERKFDWFRQWYPVALPGHLDKKVPHARTVLGIDLVVWWEREQSRWKAFADFCPHRLAPLSEGRLDENGHLQCSYHGWSFTGNGGCSRIPQAPVDGPPVHLSKRACAVVYPCLEQQGMIWVWPDASEEGISLAAQSKPPVIPVLDDPAFSNSYELIMSEMPYNHDTLAENVMDPAHIPFAHHKVLAHRDDAKPMMCNVKKGGKAGFEGQTEAGTATFLAPSVFVYNFSIPSKNKAPHPGVLTADEVASDPSKKNIHMLFICVPVRPGKSRVVFAFPRNFSRWIHSLLPRWLDHLFHLKVLDSDLNLLHLGERTLEEHHKRGLSYSQACYTPTTSDGLVVAFRKWMQEFGRGGPEWRGSGDTALPPAASKDQIMDRFDYHVRKCVVCSQAYNRFNQLQTTLRAASFALLTFLAATALRSSNPSLQPAALPLACVTIACSLAAHGLRWFIDKHYHVHGYDHGLVT